MSRWRKHIVRWLLALGVGFGLTPLKAADTQVVDITVSIAVTKSLAVNTTYYDFGSLGVDVSSVSATAIQVTNDSGGLIETYTLTGADALSDSGGTTWTLAASTGTDTYALAAQFSTARPTDAFAAWDATDYLTMGAQSCTATRFGNGTLAQSGAAVLPVVGLRDRNLWFRLHTSGIVSDTTRHTISLTLGVQ